MKANERAWDEFHENRRAEAAAQAAKSIEAHGSLDVEHGFSETLRPNSEKCRISAKLLSPTILDGGSDGKPFLSHATCNSSAAGGENRKRTWWVKVEGHNNVFLGTAQENINLTKSVRDWPESGTDRWVVNLKDRKFYAGRNTTSIEGPSMGFKKGTIYAVTVDSGRGVLILQPVIPFDLDCAGRVIEWKGKDSEWMGKEIELTDQLPRDADDLHLVVATDNSYCKVTLLAESEAEGHRQ